MLEEKLKILKQLNWRENKMKKLLIFIIVFAPIFVKSQEMYSLKNAIDTALKNNLDIRISKNVAAIAKTNNNYGMAGGLPYINANVGDNLSYGNTQQGFKDGSDNNVSGNTSNVLNAEVSATMTLFNGFKILATKKRLSLLQMQSETGLNSDIQELIANVMLKYFDVFRQQNYLKVLQSSLEVSKKKLDIVMEKKNVGMASNVLIMQAQADFNSAQQNVNSQKLMINETIQDFMNLLNTKSKNDVQLSDSLIIDRTLLLDSITNWQTRNPSYLSAEQQVKINEQVAKEVAAQRYPSLKLNAAYNFSRTDNNIAYTQYSQFNGPSAGLTLQVPIFNSNIYRTQKRVANLNISNAKLQKENLLNSLANTATKKYLTYTTLLQQIESQQANTELAKNLVDLVMTNFQNGQATILDVKAAQSSYESSAYQLINYMYEAKVAEIQLKQLIYQLSY